VLLTLLFIKRLTRLMLFAAHSDVHPNILLVPLVAGYLLYIQRRPVSAGYRSSILGTLTVTGIGLAALAAGIGGRGSVTLNDELALMALALVGFVAAGGFLFLGLKWIAAAAFPVAFLIFMVPLPGAARLCLERASALASADAAALYFSMAGTPFVRHGTVFELPGIVLEVAQECSA
jgi:exosortase